MGNVEEAFYYFMTLPQPIEPQPQYTGVMKGFTIACQNTYSIKDYPVESSDDRPLDMTGNHVLHLGHLRTINKVVLAPEHKSRYSPSLQAAFNTLPRGQLVRCFRSDAPATAPAVDICKAYTSALCKLNKVAVFNELDDMVAYDGHALLPYTIYMVENTAATEGAAVDPRLWIIADKRWNIISGMVLKASGFASDPRLRIHAFARSSKCPAITLGHREGSPDSSRAHRPQPARRSGGTDDLPDLPQAKLKALSPRLPTELMHCSTSARQCSSQ